jgi:hypothetical protein
MAVYEIDYLFQVSVYFDRDFARREVAAGYETGSNLNHCVKTRFFSQDEWHDGSLRLVPAQTKGKIASRSRIDRTELWATGAEVGSATHTQKRSFSCSRASDFTAAAKVF